MSDETTKLFVGLLPCGCWNDVIVKDDTKETARFVSKMIKNGRDVQTMSKADFLKLTSSLQCPHKPSAGELIAAAKEQRHD